jgi:hypothetical protein
MAPVVAGGRLIHHRPTPTRMQFVTAAWQSAHMQHGRHRLITVAVPDGLVVRADPPARRSATSSTTRCAAAIALSTSKPSRARPGSNRACATPGPRFRRGS